MSKTEAKRKLLFDKYANQLSDIVQAGLYHIELSFEPTFICPICLNQFSVDDLDVTKGNHLTLEDAPPYSLGGTANTLTCKKCNNESGHKIDFHLVEFLNEQEIRNFSPNTEAKVTLEHKGEKVHGLLKVDNEGVITVTHLLKNNNPEKLENYVDNTGKDDKPILFFKSSRVEVKKVEVALLKSAYILAFEHYGYAMILSKAFDVVRQQILNPDEEIYPNGFWSKQSSYNEQSKGVHFITSKNLEGIMSIFMLQTKNGTKSGYGVYLPVSIHNYQEVIENMRKLGAGDVVAFESYMNTNYFDDAVNQKMCAVFMKERNK